MWLLCLTQFCSLNRIGAISWMKKFSCTGTAGGFFGMSSSFSAAACKLPATVFPPRRIPLEASQPRIPFSTLWLAQRIDLLLFLLSNRSANRWAQYCSCSNQERERKGEGREEGGNGTTCKTQIKNRPARRPCLPACLAFSRSNFPTRFSLGYRNTIIYLGVEKKFWSGILSTQNLKVGLNKSE